jgi:SNF2 family DNA or RNA helicase
VSWTSKLRPYQLEAAEWLVDLPFGVRGRILTDGLGTGKSFSGLASQRLRYERGLMEECPAGIVLAPGVALHDWRRTAEVLWPEAFVHVLGTEAKYQRAGESDEDFEERRNAPWRDALRGRKGPAVIIGDYSQAEKLDDFLTSESIFLGSLIIDEAHALKRATTKRAKVIRGLVARSRQTTLLTGTPVHNRPYDLHNLLDLCAKGRWGSLYTWASKYFALRQGPNGFGTVIGELLDKERLIADTREVMWGRSAAELMGQLPQVQRVLKLVDAPDVARISPAKAARLREGSKLDEALRGAVRYKLAAAVELALDVDKPCVLYTWKREDARKLAEMLVKAGTTATLATGELSASARDRAIEAWKAGATTCLVCTMDAVRESATLTRADTTIFVDLAWLPGTMLQCEGRTAPSRQPEGQRRPVVYYYLVTRNGPDEVVAEALVEKLEAASGIGVKNPNADSFGQFLSPLAKPVEVQDEAALLADLALRLEARAARLAGLGML